MKRALAFVGSVICLTFSASEFSAEALAASALDPFGHTCNAINGVRFCPTTQLSERVPSWDGVPLDVDLTLPATGTGPFPTIVMEHPFPGSKASFQTTRPEGNYGTTYHYNNLYYAQQGFAVVNYSARGFGNSCGDPTSRTAGCERGWTRIADHRYEIRDSQHILGLLVDQKIAKPDALGVTGISGGGARSISLAFLNNRIRLQDGSFSPWLSPAGQPLKIGAVYARWGWDDLAYSLMPNGRRNELTPASFNPGQGTSNSRQLNSAKRSSTRKQSGSGKPRPTKEPFGIVKKTWIDRLFFGGNATAFISPEGTDPESDLTGWRSLVKREPYGQKIRNLEKTLRYIGGATDLPASGTAPLLLEQGWNDDLFPADEAIKIYHRLQTRKQKPFITLQLADVGHPRAENNKPLNRKLSDKGALFFTHFLQQNPSGNAQIAKSGGFVTGQATAHLSTCQPGSTPKALSAGSFRQLQRGQIVMRSSKVQSFNWKGSNPDLADQLANTHDPCLQFPAFPAETKAATKRKSEKKGKKGRSGKKGNTTKKTAKKAAKSLVKKTNSARYQIKMKNDATIVGSPTVELKLRTKGRNPQISARLWDISGKQMTLIGRGLFRPKDNPRGNLRFRLHPIGYQVKANHRIALELLGQDSPYALAPRAPFEVKVESLRLTLPVNDRPDKTKRIETLKK